MGCVTKRPLFGIPIYGMIWYTHTSAFVYYPFNVTPLLTRPGYYHELFLKDRMFLCRHIKHQKKESHSNKHSKKPTKPSGLRDTKQTPSPPNAPALFTNDIPTTNTRTVPTGTVTPPTLATPRETTPTEEALIQQLPLGNQALARLLLQQVQTPTPLPSSAPVVSLNQNALMALAGLMR
eukprot:scaffold133_cov169-Amphora_coffeaeformis.AAC.4